MLSAPELDEGFVGEARRVLGDLVRGGAALGWVEPPSVGEVAEVLGRVQAGVRAGDASLRAAYVEGRLAGLVTGCGTRGPRIGRTPIWRRSRWLSGLRGAASGGR